MIKKAKYLIVMVLAAAMMLGTSFPAYASETDEDNPIIEVTEYGIPITKFCAEAIDQKLYIGLLQDGWYKPYGNRIQFNTNEYIDPDEIRQNEHVSKVDYFANTDCYTYIISFSPLPLSIREKAALFAEDQRIISIDPLYLDPMPPFSNQYPNFQDVDWNRYYSRAVSWAARSGISKGYKGEIFGVGRTCTRKEFLIFLWRFKGRQESDYSNKSDTYRAIEWATSNGIIKGYKDGDLHLDEAINRKDAIIMLYRTIRSDVTTDVEFPDILALGYSKNSDTYRAIAWAEELGIAHGYSDGTFRPFEECLREQCITFLFRATCKGYRFF